jgi:hypothetical protein
VNKKKQKNFMNLGRAGFTAPGPEAKKFLRRFFQEAAIFFSLPSRLFGEIAPRSYNGAECPFCRIYPL